MDTYSYQPQVTTTVHGSTQSIIHYAVSSPVLGQRLPTADVPLPLGSRAVSVPHPQELSANFYLLPSQEETIDLTSLRNSRRLSLLD
jgi:hypothetical protein